jgi:transcriptional regulator with XRE-family HTH domain
VLRVARDAQGLSSPAVARAVGISKAQLSNIENGYQLRDGVRVPVHGKPATIAAIAAYLTVLPEELEAAGRGDAAEVLREIIRRAARTRTPDELTPECPMETTLLARLNDEFPEGTPDAVKRATFRAHRDSEQGHPGGLRCLPSARPSAQQAGLPASA